jgi:outer membrane protein OmpA-like peptidoglycan-associated protein
VCSLSLVLIGGLVATGCALREPQTIAELRQAHEAITVAKQAGAAQRFPEDYSALQKRHLEARGVYYACQDDRASQMAQAIMADANALLTKRAAAPPTPPPPAPNQAPRAVMEVPSTGEVNQPLQFDARGSSDPDGDHLTYVWQFGDGATSSFASPQHWYSKPDNYTVRLTVADGRGGSDTDTASLSVMRRMLLQEAEERVWFDFDKAVLRPETHAILQSVVQDMRENALLRCELVGHADATGSALYNMDLSRRRAAAVRDFLVSEELPAAHITVNWKGETQPIAPNISEAGRTLNRRVEIRLRPLPVQ